MEAYEGKAQRREALVSKPVSVVCRACGAVVHESMAAQCEVWAGQGKSMRMEEEVWSRLPSELIQKVLCRLPCVSMCRSRTVCKEWNSLVTDPGFLKLCAEAPCQENRYLFYATPILFYTTPTVAMKGMIRAYDTHVGVWRKLDVHYQQLDPPETNTSSRTSTGTAFNFNLILAADGGLLLLISGARLGFWKFYVCNPMLKTSKELPAIPDTPGASMSDIFLCHLVVDTSTTTCKYKVIVVNAFLRKFSIYDSMSNCWNRMGNLPGNVWDAKNWMTSVVCGNVWYAMMYEKHQGSACRLLEYDLRSGVWSADPRRQLVPTNLWGWRYIVENRGRLMLVGVTRGATDDIPNAMRLWEFNPSTLEWKEVVTLPQALVDSLFSGCTGWWHAMVYDHHLVLKCSESKTWHYNLLDGSWGCLPPVENEIFPKGAQVWGTVGNLSFITNV